MLDTISYIDEVILLVCRKHGIHQSRFRGKGGGHLAKLARQDAAVIVRATVRWDGAVFLDGKFTGKPQAVDVCGRDETFSYSYPAVARAFGHKLREHKFHHSSVVLWIKYAPEGLPTTYVDYADENGLDVSTNYVDMLLAH